MDIHQQNYLSLRFLTKENFNKKQQVTRNKKHRAESAKFERYNI